MLNLSRTRNARPDEPRLITLSNWLNNLAIDSIRKRLCRAGAAARESACAREIEHAGERDRPVGCLPRLRLATTAPSERELALADVHADLDQCRFGTP